MSRSLRPVHLLPSGDAVWLVDASWPAALVVDPVDPVASAAVVRWPASDSADVGAADRIVVADGVGIVVQDGGQVAWVRPTGTTVRPVGPGLTLTAADSEVAWLADQTYVEPDDPDSDPDSDPVAAPTPLPAGRVVALGRDGTRTTVPTPTPVRDIEITGSDVVVTMAQRPVAHPTSDTSWRFEYPTTRVRVDRDELLGAGPAGGEVLPAEDTRRAARRAGAWFWLETDPGIVRRYGLPAGGLLWWAGAPTGGDRLDRHAIVVGHDPTTAEEVVRIDLGRGSACSARVVGDELWVAVARHRPLPSAPRDRGVDVLAVSADGGTRTVHRADSIDITASAPPLRRPAAHLIEEHTHHVRGMFDRLDTFWHSPDGSTRPLSEGLTEPSVSVVGEWPQARVVVTMKHPRRPGLLLRRTLPLFDDAGQPIDHEYAAITLMEDLDTDHLAPAGEAVDGVLDT